MRGKVSIEAAAPHQSVVRPRADGLSLRRLLDLNPLSPEQAVALGHALLHELVKLESEGRAHGGLSASLVRVTADGGVRLVGAPASTSSLARDSEPGADVRSAGRLVCEALGVEAEPMDPIRAAPRAERIAPHVVITARALAQGALGRTPSGAARLFAERAGTMAARDRLEVGRQELADLVARLEHGAPVAAVTASGPTRSHTEANGGLHQDPGRWRGTHILASGVAVATILAGLWAGATLVHRAAPGDRSRAVAVDPRPPAPAVPPAVTTALPATADAGKLPAAAATPAPTAWPVPAYAPAAAWPIDRVAAAAGSGCGPGLPCTLVVSIAYSSAARTDFAWGVEVFDRCTGARERGAQGQFTAPAGWNHIEVSQALVVPATMRAPTLVVVTERPSRAASAPLELGSSSCQAG